MTEKVKILCLHGYMQNALKFRSQTGGLRKILKHEAEFYFLSAPHKVPESEHLEGEEEQRGWWFTKPKSFNSKDKTNHDGGMTESLKEIEKFFQEHGPFHGILGFSQGACLTALLCAMKQLDEITLDFQFVIIVSGFKSACSRHAKYYESLININSLHVIGETDQVITSYYSYALADVFVNPVILKHPGGHFVPGKSSLRKEYVDFLKAQKT